ncbi:hypothetical protein ACFVU4_03060 [Streptomyces sp. NPDC058107]|uniref:hypothetical protein n=1 Tax=Streptomyces sp. NPDC058107 TaxID=3346343 RepID=UPI0036EF9AFB
MTASATVRRPPTARTGSYQPGCFIVARIDHRDRTDVDQQLAAAPRKFARTPTSSSSRATTAAR